MISKHTYLYVLFIFGFSSCFAQKEQPISQTSTMIDPQSDFYHTIPAYPDTYSAKHVAARMIDGLGFRLYWSTKDLTATDLEYKPSVTGRTTMATMIHLNGLCEVIYNTVINEPTIRPSDTDSLSYEELRDQALKYLKNASDVLKAKDGNELDQMQVKFQRGERSSEFPFWNLINGPIADAMWHCGQVVMLRRASGNPMETGVNVFMGSKKG